MAITSVAPAGATAQASDSLQAAYFRSALADYRAVLAVRIKRQVAKLDAMSADGDSFAIGRMRHQLRDDEAEYRDLGRLIAGIDRRFSSLWAD